MEGRGPGRVPSVDVSLEEAASTLGVDEERVKLFEAQGRLEGAREGGERRFDAESVYRMKAENLMRGAPLRYAARYAAARVLEATAKPV